MRQGQNNKNRMRGRNNNNARKGSGSRSQSYESNGPDVKVRGNAQQVVEKYLTLARDATLSGDRIDAESYYQFAEHYYRIMTANAVNEQQRQQQSGSSDQQVGDNSHNSKNAQTGDENARGGNNQIGGKQLDNADATDPGSESSKSSGQADGNGNETGRSRGRSSRSNRRPKELSEIASGDKVQPDDVSASPSGSDDSLETPMDKGASEDAEESARA